MSSPDVHPGLFRPCLNVPRPCALPVIMATTLQLIIMVVSPDDVWYRMLASSIEDVLRLEDGRTVEMVQDEDTMR